MFPSPYTDYPMYPHRPGKDFSQQYRIEEFTTTGWNWGEPVRPPVSSRKR